MDVEFEDEDLERLERDPDFTAGLSRDIIRAFRKVMGAVRAAVDARDLYNGGLRTEKLKGARADQHSIRLNKQWRLIAEINGSKIYVKGIEDYH